LSDPAHNTYSAIILAGGEGRRAGGADKGLLLHRGAPLIEHVIAVIAPQVDDIIISANRNTGRYQDYGYDVIRDTDDIRQGPLSGILACLPACRHERVLVVPCDMPNLPDNIVDRLGAENSADISIAEVDSQLQLAMIVRRSLAPSIAAALASDELSLMRWVKSRNYRSVTFDKKSRFTNLNEGI
jgi:molybdopterin-guanine dinucleotide biosynthesis protein A